MFRASWLKLAVVTANHLENGEKKTLPPLLEIHQLFEEIRRVGKQMILC